MSPNTRKNKRERTELASVKILGQSVLERTVSRLHRAGVRPISLITSRCSRDLSSVGNARVTIVEDQKERWAAAERVLRKYAQLGLRTVLVAKVGAYVELDLVKALTFHLAQRQPVTPVHNKTGALDYWFVEAGETLSNRDFRRPDLTANAKPFFVSEYVNRMRDAFDLRHLVADAFLGRCSIAPTGREIKPGVWVEHGAKVHRSARLVPPVYLGRDTCVQPAAVITKFSNLESSCRVGEGSVVHEASVLPHTLIGSGLDVKAAVVSGDEFVDLRRNLMLRIDDPTLITDAATRHEKASDHNRELEASLETYKTPGRASRPPQPEYSGYLSRAALRLLGVFRDEV